LPDLKGNLVSLPDGFKGKIVLIHFWASWCPYCIKEMVAIESLVLKFKGKGLAPFSINVGDRKVVAETYVAPLKISYSILLDPKSLTARKYGVTGIPTTFILDRQGILRFKIPGEIDQKGLDRLLAKLL
jgi:thiol-disulfide isomerase/thioredoxin